MKKTIIAANLILILLLAGCGNFHSHKWADANYQEPMKCSVCGETIGEHLEADFAVQKIEPSLKDGQTAEYHTIVSRAWKTLVNQAPNTRFGPSSTSRKDCLRKQW